MHLLLACQKFLLLPPLSFLVKVSLKKKKKTQLALGQAIRKKEIHPNLNVCFGRPGVKSPLPSWPDFPEGTSRGGEAKPQAQGLVGAPQTRGWCKAVLSSLRLTKGSQSLQPSHLSSGFIFPPHKHPQRAHKKERKCG